MMDNARLEKWVHEICDRVKLGLPVEDDRVELKATWIDIEKAARILGGHANAARGQPILWLVGVDEKANSVVGADFNELSNWLPQLIARFDDSISPHLVNHLNIVVDGFTVAALYFETNRPPYVLKPTQGHSVREIPWRVGNRTESARRGDLIKILVPVAALPVGEFDAAELKCLFFNDGTFRWEFEGAIYLRSSAEFPVSLPRRHCSVSFRDSVSAAKTHFDSVKLNAADHAERRLEFSASAPLVSDGYQVVVRGCGMLRVTASKAGPKWSTGYPDQACVEFRCSVPEASDLPLVVTAVLQSLPQEPSGNLKWALASP